MISHEGSAAFSRKSSKFSSVLKALCFIYSLIQSPFNFQQIDLIKPWPAPVSYCIALLPCSVCEDLSLFNSLVSYQVSSLNKSFTFPCSPQRQIMVYPGCLGHLFSAGGKASWGDDTFLQLHRRPGRGDLHQVTLDQLRSSGINSSLRCAHDIPKLGFTKLSILSCWKQPLKVFLNDFFPFPSILFQSYVILN